MQVSCVFFKNRIKTYAVLHSFPNTSNLVYHSPVLEIEKQQNPAKQKNPHCYLEPFDLFIHYTHSLQLPVSAVKMLVCALVFFALVQHGIQETSLMVF